MPTAPSRLGDRQLPFFWLGALLQMNPRGLESGRRTYPVVVIRSAQQRIVVHVDDVLGNQEVVVKNLGPQLSRMPGLAGMTLFASGVPALIYNPVALATLYGESARAATMAALAAPAEVAPVKAETPTSAAPLILVVDDSLTVRRITQRLLVREGYRVVLAKDGLDALERLAEETPTVVLSDIEMPRMDGFDLVRNLRGDARWRELPVIMITSRIAQKHRDHAGELGVDHYLGKPYAEEDLLALDRPLHQRRSHVMNRRSVSHGIAHTAMPTEVFAVSELVDHLAELTGFRDRDRLDVTLVGALRDLLSPLSVAMWGCVGEPGQQRWIKRALLGQ